jgi:hypothetical protein
MCEFFDRVQIFPDVDIAQDVENWFSQFPASEAITSEPKYEVRHKSAQENERDTVALKFGIHKHRTELTVSRLKGLASTTPRRMTSIQNHL